MHSGSPSTKTIVFCCNTTFAIVNFRGGAIKALINKGYRVVIVAPKDEHVALGKQLGAEYREWNINGQGTSALHEINAAYRLKSILGDIQPGLCYFYTIKCVIYGAFACRLLNIPFISVITGLGYAFINETWISQVARFFYRKTLKWSKEIWFLNEDDRSTFLQHQLISLKHPTRTLPGEGIDLIHFDAPPLHINSKKNQSITFLMIGRLLRDKGTFEYADAAKKLKQKQPHTLCQLLGETNAANPSAISYREVSDWQKQGFIEYLGTSTDVRPLIAAADCIVLPSYREGAPRVLMEAAAMRRPVIASNVPGCRDLVKDQHTGYLCKVRNQDDLLQKMLDFCQLSQIERSSMGENGRKFIQSRCDEKMIIDQYIQTSQLYFE